MGKSVVVCLSGGADSSVAALLLKDRGWEVAAVTYWFWSFPGAPDYAGKTKCCSLEAAALSASELGIPHETIDASQEFDELIVRDFVHGYRGGETPNPCGRCNRYLRFGLALAYAREHGFDFVATGHHVRTVREPGGLLGLLRGTDPGKDQSYFLYGLRQRDLCRLVFPVGELTKDAVFAIATETGLTCAQRRESQDLCFALAGDTTFLFDEADFSPGPIIDSAGKRIGTHGGLPRYTVGQRRGLEIPSGQPLFVVDIDSRRNTLVVGPEEALYRSFLTALDASYISGHAPESETRVEAKIRYRSPAAAARILSISNDQFSLAFDEPQRAIAPGQIAAIYDGDRLLGGGTIARGDGDGHTGVYNVDSEGWASGRNHRS
jgi:tRNA-specific 2-thiouridylase